MRPESSPYNYHLCSEALPFVEVTPRTVTQTDQTGMPAEYPRVLDFSSKLGDRMMDTWMDGWMDRPSPPVPAGFLLYSLTDVTIRRFFPKCLNYFIPAMALKHSPL